MWKKEGCKPTDSERRKSVRPGAYKWLNAQNLSTPCIGATDSPNTALVKPPWVAQVAFTEWTDGGSLRHARFNDLRTDKRAADVMREG